MRKILLVIILVALLSAPAMAKTAEEWFFDIGNKYLDEGRYYDAIYAYSKAIQLNPNFAEAYNNRGLAYHHLG